MYHQLRCEDEHNWWVRGEDLIGCIHDISEGTLQLIPIICEEKYEGSYLKGLELIQ